MLKTHLITGLNYLCYTTKGNPYKYKGSGKRWKNHLKRHGNKIGNYVIGVYNTEDDLISALKEKRIKGAGLDVFNIEPLPINSEFINFKECILGSHNSSNTLEAVKRVNTMTIDMVIKISESDVSKVYKERRII